MWPFKRTTVPVDPARSLLYTTPYSSNARRAGIYCWPKGLRWFRVKRRSTGLIAGLRAPKYAATFTIKSKGRNGAKARQKLMTVRRDAVVLPA